MALTKSVAFRLALGLLLSLGLTYFLAGFNFWSFDALTLDLRQQLSIDAPTSGKIVTVSLTEEEYPRLGRVWDQSKVRLIVESIQRYKPLHIVWTFIDFDIQNTAELPQWRQFFDEQRNVSIVPGSFRGTYSTDFEAALELKEAPYFYYADFLTKDGLGIYGGDQRRRRLMIEEPVGEKLPSLVRMERWLGFSASVQDFPYSRFWEGLIQVYFKIRSLGSYGQIPLFDVIDGKVDSDKISGKIVLLGGFNSHDTLISDSIFRRREKTGSLYKDQVVWPYNEILANGLDTFFTKDYVRIAPEWVDRVICFVVISVFLLLALFLSPPRAAVSTLLMQGLFIVGAWGVYFFWGWMIDMTRPLIGMAGAQYVLIPLLLIVYVRARDREEVARTHASELKLMTNRIAAKSARADLGLRISMQVAHDLKAPTMALNILSDKVRNELSGEMLDMLKTSVDRLQMIARDLIGQYRTGYLNLKQGTASCDLVRLLERLISDHSRSWPRVKFQFASSTKEASSPFDAGELERVFANLIHNSVEALLGGSVPHPQVDISIDAEGEFWLVRVKDNGPGVNELFKDRIFEEGFTHGKAHGTGLGLSQARSSLRRCGGDLDLIKSEGGAVFEVRIPKAAAHLSLHFDHPVLVVEDSPDEMAALKQSFSSTNHLSFFFDGPEDAVEKIRELETNETAYSLFTDLIFHGHELTGFDLLSVTGSSCRSRYLHTSLADNDEIQRMGKELKAQIVGKSTPLRVSWE
ncbi:MAG: ATP-binding protein [Bdellovibrionales bacterium]